MPFHLGPLPGDDPALELAVAHALVKRASAGAVDGVLRIHRPTTPTAVFGRRDTRLPGFAAAVDGIRAAGFTPAVRATGGRAVAYTRNALVVDQVGRQHDPHAGLADRFARFGGRFVEVFRSIGIDAHVGAVPGEYCPGEHSVNARGVVKLVGTAQRVVRDAWLFSSLVIVDDDGLIAPVLKDVYAHLGQPFDEASVGSLAGEAPGLDIATVEAALLTAYAVAHDAVPVERATLDLARELVDQHRV